LTALGKQDVRSTAVLSPNFQIEIPLEVRQSLGLQPGQKVQFIEYEGRVQLVRVLPIEEARGMFPGLDTTIEREPDREL
jgi:AbrB family looped-hinge helix DNA binding protein